MAVITNIGLCFWWNLAHENVIVARQCRTFIKLITKENCLQANVSRYSSESDIWPLSGVEIDDEVHFLWKSKHYLKNTINSELNDNLQGFHNQNPSDRTKIVFGTCLDRLAQVLLLTAVLT